MGLNPENVSKSFSNVLDTMEKAAKLPEGSKRKFGPNWYIKQGGKWKYIAKDDGSGKPPAGGTPPSRPKSASSGERSKPTRPSERRELDKKPTAAKPAEKNPYVPEKPTEKPKPSAPRTGFGVYDKAVQAEAELQKQIEQLQAKKKKAGTKANEQYKVGLEKMGFKDRSYRDDYNQVTVSSVIIPGGKNFNAGSFSMNRKPGERNVTVFYRDEGLSASKYLGKIKSLPDVKVFKRALEKNPMNAVQEHGGKMSNHDAQRYIKEVTENFYTGRKNKNDVQRMTPKEILAKFKIPNVSATHVEGKRSDVFGRDTSRLTDDTGFFSDFKRNYAKYGKPTKIKTEKYDTRGDDGGYEFQGSYHGEREWSYSKGERVIVQFKNDAGNSRYVNG